MTAYPEIEPSYDPSDFEGMIHSVKCSLGQKIRDARGRLNLSQCELANLSGFSEELVGKLETAEARDIDYRCMFKFLTPFEKSQKFATGQVSVQEFIGR